MKENNRQEPAVSLVEETTAPSSAIGFFEAVYGIFFQPLTTLRSLAAARKIGWGLLIYFTVYLFQGFLSLVYGTPNNLALGPWQQEFTSLFTNWMWLVMLVPAFGLWFGLLAVINALAEMFKGKGDFRGLLAASAFTNLPLTLNSIFAFLGYLVSRAAMALTVLEVIVFLWVLVLQILAIRESHNLSTGVSVLIFFIPALFFILALIIIAVTLALMLGPLWSELLVEMS